MEDGAPAAPVRRRPSSTVSEAFGPAAAAAALERQRRASAPSLLSLPSLTLSANDGRRLAAVAAQDRGRVAFRGSITVHNAPGGRCSLDPKLSFVASPGPVTAAPLDFGGIVVPGVAFGRLTEHKNATAVPRAAVLAEPRGRAAKREATIELYGRAHAVGSTGGPQPARRRRSPPPYESSTPLQTFLRSERVSESLMPRRRSPGPVYDVRAQRNADVGAFAKERRFEQARFSANYAPLSFTPAPSLKHNDGRRPCSVLFVPLGASPSASQASWAAESASTSRLVY
ncbi:hypothetical protein M885DRAFT_617809 [Pelagophyceae sp. CCMP2097]|nr:hypothetical protein M885DRAFT_617809 [Pelagophyceae sp. CCMP2097]